MKQRFHLCTDEVVASACAPSGNVSLYGNEATSEKTVKLHFRKLKKYMDHPNRKRKSLDKENFE